MKRYQDLTLKLFVGLGNDSRTDNNPKNKHHSKVFFDISLNKSLLRPLNLLKQYVIRLRLEFLSRNSSQNYDL